MDPNQLIGLFLNGELVKITNKETQKVPTFGSNRERCKSEEDNKLHGFPVEFRRVKFH